MIPTVDARHDIVIVGNGVAALAAARALRQRGAATLRIAPNRSSSGNRGELLGPLARRSLATLAWEHLLRDRRMSLPAEARFSAWGSPALVKAPVNPDLGAGWYVDRSALEAAMQEDAGPSVDAAVTGCERTRDSWRLSLSTGAQDITARFVIDASGRSAIIARRLGGPRRRESGLVAMHRTIALSAPDTMAASLIEAAPDGWWYSSPVPNGDAIFLAHFTDADLLPDGAGHAPGSADTLLASAPHTRARLESLDAVLPQTPWRIDVAATTLHERVSGDGWAAAGDAAIALDPLSGHGLTVALWTGIQAASVALAWLDGNREPSQAYQASVTAGMRRFTADACRHYRAEQRFSDRPFWSRRQGTDQ